MGKKRVVSKAVLYFTLFVIVVTSLFAVPDISVVGEVPYTFGAHRGNSAKFVENTFDAIKDAVDDPKYQFIEIDVQYTKDNKIIVFHDLTLYRFQKQRFWVAGLTYDELVTLSRYDIPLYEDVMDYVGNKKKINIEIKSQGDFEEDKKLIARILNDCEKRGISDQILLSSISSDIVRHIDRTYPKLKVGQIFLAMPCTYFPIDYFIKRFYDRAAETGADYLMIHGINLRCFESLIRLKPEDKTLLFWHFDDKLYLIHADKNDKIWGSVQ